MKSWGTNVVTYLFGSHSPKKKKKAKFQILLFDKCPTLTSSISSTPVSFHCGISDAHICETFLSLGKKKKFAAALKDSLTLRRHPRSPPTRTDGVHRAATSCDSLRGDELALSDILQPPPSWINTGSLAFLTWKRSAELSHTGLRPSGGQALKSAASESVPFASQP